MTPTLVAPGPLPPVDHSYHADRAHYTPGRSGQAIRYCILHNTEGTDSRDYLATTPGSAVSIHALIQGATRYNLVDYADTAWHVGYALPDYRNGNCLGVELESRNTNGHATHPYAASQYNTLAHLLATWLYSYGLAYDTAVRCHRDIAVYPPDYPTVALRGQLGRRHDPSGLDLDRVRRETLGWLAFFRALPAGEQAAWII